HHIALFFRLRGATAPLLGPGQHWVLADSDAGLLARARVAAPVGVSVELQIADLACGTRALLAPAPDLVTASAFFDLCGAAWIERFADDLAAAGAALHAVLSYDGRELWLPAAPQDAAALAAFHADQRRDKGLGPALGPDAHAHLARCLAGHGYRVDDAPSDWVLTPPQDAALIAALAEGSAAAIAGALGAEAAGAWLAAHRQAARVVIGHRDLLALPPG
ncbi:MAG: class I SAM-dependent methyltransferase, partial [Thermohalobaculum sp.]|nr:class I SAM-dependent methyltransferase [Thermohalobaculum sp.]